MKQLLERKYGTRTIVFALLLTMSVWLAPVNVGVVKAAGDTKIPVAEEGYLLFDEATGAITGYEGRIKNVTIPETFESNKITAIGYDAFSDCSSLTSVSIPNSVTTIGEMAFSDCSSLTSIGVDTDNENYSSQDGVLFDKAKEQLIQYPIGNKRSSYEVPDSVTTIGRSAFSGCSGLTNVSIPDSVTSIELGAFGNCSGLTSVSIPNSVISIRDSAFSGCSGLTSISISNSVTYIGNGAFGGCRGLTSVSIPYSVTTIEGHIFVDCSGLTSVDIPDSITTIDSYAFSGCSSLSSITIPNSVTIIGHGAFSDCSGLTSIDVGEDNEDYSSQDGVLFNKSKEQLIQYPIGNKRSSYEVPNGVTSIGSSAFMYCSSLTSVAIPNSVTSIGNEAFFGCSSLTSVIIPDSVTSIGDYTFGYDTYLKVSGFKIYGYSNDSAAAKYAKENGFEYIVVNDENPSDSNEEKPATKAGQTISGANSFTKTYGDRAFPLNAKAKTKLAYKTSDQNVATVNGSGKVTIKGTGKATITITAAATANYNSATKKVTITVKPKKVTSVKVKKDKKQMTVSWKKDSKASGYQITYAQNKAFTKSKKNVTISKNKTVKTAVKKLKPKKTYYVKVRAYKKAGSTKIYGAYSAVKTVKVK